MKRSAMTLAVALALSTGCVHAKAPVDHVMLVSDIVNVKVNTDGSSTTERTELLKAMDASGAAALQSMSIPFNATRQTVQKVSASAAFPDDTYIKVPAKNIITVPLVSPIQAPEYSQVKRLQIHFPKLTAGAVVSVHTIVHDAHAFLPGENYSFFQLDPRTMPLGDISYTLTAPAWMHLNVHANAVKGGVAQFGDMQRWTFSAEKLPSLFNVASQSERLAKSPYLLVTQSSTPEGMARGYLERILPAEHVSLELQELADTLGKGSVEPATLMANYYAWINKHLTLIDIPFDMGNASPRKADDIVLSGYGTAEDRVIVLQALMRAKAIPTDVVMVPTLPITWSDMLPAVPAFYNRLLLAVRNGQQPLDIGNPVLALGTFDPRDRGKFGIRIAPDGGVGVMQVPDRTVGNSESAVTTNIEIESDGSVRGASTIADYGDLATIDREQVAALQPLALRASLTPHAPPGTTIGISKIDSPYTPDSRFLIVGNYMLSSAHSASGGYTMRVPRVFTSLSPMDAFANAQGAGLCEHTYREEDTTIHSVAGLPFLPVKRVDVTGKLGVGNYTATYDVDNSAHTLVVKRRIRLNVSGLTCDHGQQAALSVLAAAVRKDLETPINVLR